MSEPMNSWALVDALDLQRSEEVEIPRLRAEQVEGTFRIGENSAWLALQHGEEGGVALRLGHSPAAALILEEATTSGDSSVVSLHSELGTSRAVVTRHGDSSPIFRVETELTPVRDLRLPFWPRDLVMFGAGTDPLASRGRVRVRQSGPGSGVLYATFEDPELGSFLYLQNLTSLNEYFSLTQSSGADRVGGEWPYLGFSLPASEKGGLPKATPVVVSDAFIVMTPITPRDELEAGELFLDLLAEIYLALPRPDTTYREWLHVVDRSLEDVIETESCWKDVDGRRFLNAYLEDTDTPPESMVQLAVALPLVEFAGWDDRAGGLSEDLTKGLEEFFDPEVSSLLRWHPKAVGLLDNSEAHRRPRVMDSWYLYHPLINLSRLALDGNESAMQLLLDSVDFAIAVAHHFDYRWPVLFNVDTLDVVRAETAEGEGGEFDVGGSYALLMMQLFDMTGEERFVTEAKRAADVMIDRGFDIFYQLNDTSFATGAFHRLWQITRDERHRRLAELCAANVFAHAWLWECNYGNAEAYSTFFSLFPLKDAPYFAAYEEVEATGALDDYLRVAGDDLRPSLRLLIPEVLKYLLNHGCAFYPPLLPEGVVGPHPTSGVIRRHLWIPLEDLRDGWEASGQVGQQVYGVGCSFAVVARHFHKAGDLVLYCEYPISDLTANDRSLSFRILGDPRLTCRVRLLGEGREVPEATLRLDDEKVADSRQGVRTQDGALEWEAEGGRRVVLRWQTPERSES